MRRFPFVLLFAFSALSAQQPVDSAYTTRIRELAPTDPNWKLSTELADYLSVNC